MCGDQILIVRLSKCKEHEVCQVEQKVPRQVQKNPHWFCRAIPRQHIHACCGRTLNVAWGLQNGKCRLYKHQDSGGCMHLLDYLNTWWMKHNGFLHSTSAPGHPTTNWLAERYIQTFKSGMKKLANTAMDIEDKVSLLLLEHRTTPNCTIGQMPADLFLNRHMRTRLDHIRPTKADAVCKKQYVQKFQHDQHAEDRQGAPQPCVGCRSRLYCDRGPPSVIGPGWITIARAPPVDNRADLCYVRLRPPNC